MNHKVFSGSSIYISAVVLALVLYHLDCRYDFNVHFSGCLSKLPEEFAFWTEWVS